MSDPICPSSEIWLLWQSQALSPPQRTRFIEHLRTCSTCRTRLKRDFAPQDFAPDDAWLWDDSLAQSTLQRDRSETLTKPPESDQATEVWQQTQAVEDDENASAKALIASIKARNASAVPDIILPLIPESAGTSADGVRETRLFETHQDESSATDIDLSFLKPANHAEALGRIGDYDVISVLGSGGMGIVLRGYDPKLKRDVAIKVMKPSLAAKAEARARFLREAEAAAGIEHDHIVTIYQVGEDQAVPFIAIRFLKGESLESRLRRELVLEESELINVSMQVARGLEAAHNCELMHRDIKPDNIWLDAYQDRVILLDFGLARLVAEDQDLTQSGALLGTPRYMSPEQATAALVDARSDLFSLGSVMYRMATGRAPFSGARLTATLLEIVKAEPTPGEQLRSNLSPPLAELIHDLLARAPEDRPATARDVLKRLTRINKENKRVLSPEPNSSPKQPRRDPFNKRTTLLGTSALIATLALVFTVAFVGAAKGTLQVTTPEKQPLDGIAIEVLQGDQLVATLQSENDWSASLPPGDYCLQLRGAGDFTLPEESTISLFRFDRKKIFLQPIPAYEIEDWSSENYRLDRQVAQWTLLQRGRLLIKTQKHEFEVRQIEHLPNEPFRVLSIYLEGLDQISSSELDSLSRLPSLEVLGLSKSAVGPEIVPGLAKIPALRYLHLNETNIKSSHLHTSLEVPYFSLNGDQIDDDWRFLGFQPNLKTLLIDRADHLGSEATWSRFSNLETLVISASNPMSLASLAPIRAANPKLKVMVRTVGVGNDNAVLQPNPEAEIAREMAADGHVFEGTAIDQSPWRIGPREIPDGLPLWIRNSHLKTVHVLEPKDVDRLARATWNFFTINAADTTRADLLAQRISEGLLVRVVDFSRSDLSKAAFLAMANNDRLYRVIIYESAISREAIERFKQLRPNSIVMSSFGTYAYRHELNESKE